ncbi:4346_t:CDS:2 [Acaulospora morrowiae]|uniref:4346_t:CDS:1 n=1 Tax=Acaulospora morrowiae TaxID=94023 RepID=A0A9N9GH52_9GLOM|nr:4346_t:CDS:2 [Acaulospora morrowiae]
MSVEIEMNNIIILEGIESDFGIASQPELIKNIIRALMDTNLICDYMAGNRKVRRSRTGAKYFNEFRTHFWERPEDDFDRIRNINSSNRRQCRIEGNNTPAPFTGEVEHELGQTLPGNRRSRRTSVDSRRSRRRSASPSPPRDAINTNTNNPGVENPEQNIDEARNNSSEMNQSQVVSNREVVVSGNIPLSQNDSDVSMYDVGDSQTFSNVESINEEVG